jgi:uncharacterized protein YbjT (DUF2867 family)
MTASPEGMTTIPVQSPESMDKYSDSLLCSDLPTTAQPHLGKILVTGATGYIGGRLVPELLARGYRVAATVRARASEFRSRWPEAEVVEADLLDRDSLGPALEGVHTAYYLVHSLHLGQKKFEAADLEAASNFRDAARKAGIKRIIYLGGLGDVRTPLSPHLRSRIQVAEELMRGTLPVTILRAAIIIGSGSASYEIVKNLVRNLPVICLPPWAKTRCQPIAIRDVIKYLVGVLETPETAGHSYDIGGLDIFPYEMILRIFADFLDRKIIFIPMPLISSCRFCGYMAGFFTPVPAPLVMSLMCGLKNEVVCQSDEIREVLSFRPLSFREALIRALTREEQDAVHTRWSDAYPPAHELAMKLQELESPPRFSSTCSLITEKPAPAIFRTLCRLGGEEGWFHSTFLWRIRGGIDRILLGVGTSRGRKSPSRLNLHDVIDFWRVEELKDGEMLLLRAEMKLPGRAWLKLHIEPRKDGTNSLSVTAYFDARTLSGALYWHFFQPFHHFIFRDIIREIERRS